MLLTKDRDLSGGPQFTCVLTGVLAVRSGCILGFLMFWDRLIQAVHRAFLKYI